MGCDYVRVIKSNHLEENSIYFLKYCRCHIVSNLQTGSNFEEDKRQIWLEWGVVWLCKKELKIRIIVIWGKDIEAQEEEAEEEEEEDKEVPTGQAGKDIIEISIQLLDLIYAILINPCNSLKE